MIDKVQALDGLRKAASGNAENLATTKTSGSFADLVNGFVQQTNDHQVNSATAIDDLIAGKTDNVREVVMAVANAEMSFQFFMEVRNKLVDSYKELMNMQF